MEEFDILSLLMILIAAWLGGTAANRLGYPAILGELIIGIVLGPAVLGWLEGSEMVSVLSEAGIILLMVYIGIEIDFRDLQKASWPGLLAAAGGFIVPFALGYYVMLSFGSTNIGALFVAIAMGVTSLVTKSRILVDLKLLNTRIAYVLMAGALISDTLALIIFAGILNFADMGNVDALALGLVAVKAVLFFATTILIGIYGLPLFGKWINRMGITNRTLLFTMMLIIAFAYAELAELAGMHGILGAFMAGLFIRDDVFDRKVSKELNDVFHDVSVGFLAPIFFVSAGFNVSLDVFQSDLQLLLTIIGLAIVGKVLGTVLFYLPTGYGWREGLAIGAGMNGRGAVEIVIAGIGLQMGIINNEIFSILVFMAIFTTFTVPFFLTWATNWLRGRGELVYTVNRNGFLFLGIHPVSLVLAKHLKESGEVTMIDSNRYMVKLAKQSGFETVFGNGLREDVLEEANAANANTFLGLTSNSEINVLAAQIVHENYLIPEKYILVSPDEGGAGVNLLQPIGATTIFAKKMDLESWNHKISLNQTREFEAVVTENVSTNTWLKQEAKDQDLLPLVIVNRDGAKRPFRYGDEIAAGEKVIYLR